MVSAASCFINLNVESGFMLDYSLSLVEGYYFKKPFFKDFISANRKGVQDPL